MMALRSQFLYVPVFYWKVGFVLNEGKNYTVPTFILFRAAVTWSCDTKPVLSCAPTFCGNQQERGFLRGFLAHINEIFHV